MSDLPTLAEIEAACLQVHSVVPSTPQYCWPLLSGRVGTEVWVKHENHTAIGAFKARSAVIYAAGQIRRQPATPGLIAATTGNHGQAVAMAAARLGIPSIVVVPAGNSLAKNATLRARGARLVEHPGDFQAAKEHAASLAEANGYCLVPNYHPEIVRGVASSWWELFAAVQDIDVAYVAIGLGSSVCAAIAVRNALRLSTTIVGVVSDLAPCYALSFEAGRAVEALGQPWLADGLSCRLPEEEPLSIVMREVDHIVRVTDDEVAEAMRFMFRDTHNLVEGAGAAGLAGALKERGSLGGRWVAVVASGSNVDLDRYAEVLRGADPSSLS